MSPSLTLMALHCFLMDTQLAHNIKAVHVVPNSELELSSHLTHQQLIEARAYCRSHQAQCFGAGMTIRLFAVTSS